MGDPHVVGDEVEDEEEEGAALVHDGFTAVSKDCLINMLGRSRADFFKASLTFAFSLRAARLCSTTDFWSILLMHTLLLFTPEKNRGLPSVFPSSYFYLALTLANVDPALLLEEPLGAGEPPPQAVDLALPGGVEHEGED